MAGGLGTGIDVGTSSLKIVQGRFRGESFQLTRVIKVDFDPADTRPVGERLAETLGHASLKAKNALLGITGKDLVLRYTQVPPVSPYRLKTLMDFEVKEILSGGGGDVAAGYGVLPFSGPGDENLVLLALAKNAWLDERLGALEQAGIGVAAACPSTIALFNCFLKNGEFKAEETTLLVSIGAENTDLAIQKNADLLFARNVSFGGAQFTRALADAMKSPVDRAERLKVTRATVSSPGVAVRGGEEDRISRALAPAAGQLVSTIQSSILFCRNQTKLFDLHVDRVLVSGGGARLQGLPEYLSSSLNVAVEPFDPMGGADGGKLPAEEAETARASGLELTAALGLAQMAVDPRFFRIEVLPETIRRRRELKTRTVPMLAAGVLVLGYLGVSFAVEKRNLQAAQERYDRVSRIEKEVDRRARSHATLSTENRARLDKLNFLAQRAGAGPAALQTLQLLDHWLPPEFWLTHLQTRDVELDASGALVGKSEEQPEGPKEPPYPGVSIKGMGRVRDRPLSEPFNDFVKNLKNEAGVRVLAHPFTQKRETAEFELLFAFGAPPAPAAPEPEKPAKPERK